MGSLSYPPPQNNRLRTQQSVSTAITHQPQERSTKQPYLSAGPGLACDHLANAGGPKTKMDQAGRIGVAQPVLDPRRATGQPPWPLAGFLISLAVVLPALIILWTAKPSAALAVVFRLKIATP